MVGILRQNYRGRHLSDRVLWLWQYDAYYLILSNTKHEENSDIDRKQHAPGSFVHAGSSSRLNMV